MNPAPSLATASGLDRETKQEIRKWVLRLRHLLQDDFEKQLKRYGVEPGKPMKLPPEYLDAVEKQAHSVIVATIRRDAQNEMTTDDALTAYVRECAFTLLNRLVGLKCMESRNILAIQGEPNEVISTRPEYGERSRLLWQMRDTDRKYRQDETLLWHDGLIAAFRAVTSGIGVLFDPDSPWSQLWPTQKTLMEAVRAINGLDAVCGREGISSVYASPDFLGWVYQFFNVEEKEQIRTATGGKPRTSHELAVINQFYTPDWIVKFLVDNTLGRVWLQMHPDTRLRPMLSYLVPNTGEDEHVPLKPVRDLKLLDPACGTMHMGQYAFGLLYEMYLEEQDKAGQAEWPGIPSVSYHTDIPAAILENNLFGIDIDARAIQIAALTLLLTMKEQAQAHGLDPQTVRVHRMNLVCADAVNLGEAHMNEFFNELDPAVFGGDAAMRRAVKAVWAGLQHVAELGSLVQVGEEVERALQEPTSWKTRLFDPTQGNFADALGVDDPQRPLTAEERRTAREQLEAALVDYAGRHTGADDINQRLFAQETSKALTLLDLLRNHYDAIVMNPPFGYAPERTHPYLDRAYPNWCDNILCAFVAACKRITQETGYVGMVSDFRVYIRGGCENFRRHELLNGAHLKMLMNLGWEVLDGANVEVCALVLSRSRSNHSPIFLHLSDSADKETAFCKILTGAEPGRRFQPPISQLQSYPWASFAYRMLPSVSQAFAKFQKMAEHFAYCPSGGLDASSPRYYRQFWEVEASQIAPDGKYAPFWNGIDFRASYYVSTDNVILWENDGSIIDNDPRAFMRLKRWFFRPCIAWGKRTDSLSVASMNGHAFSKEGQAIFPNDDLEHWRLISLLNSKLLRYTLNQFCGQHKLGSHIGHLPVVPPEMSNHLGDKGEAIHNTKLTWDAHNEISAHFTEPWITHSIKRLPNWLTIEDLLGDCLEWETACSTKCQKVQADIDATVYELYAITPEDRDLIDRELLSRPSETVWPQLDGKTLAQKRAEHVCRLLSWLVKNSTEAEPDGIIPLVPCAGKASLGDRVRKGLEEVFGVDRALGVESEIVTILGKRITLESWLAKSWFKYHVGLYKRRPIYWHVTDGVEGGFSAVVHYHRFTHDRLLQLRSAYLYEGYILRLQSEIGRLKTDQTNAGQARMADLERLLNAAHALDEKLRQIQEGEIPIQVAWKTEDAQPQGWRPDIDDGVKVNIAPFEQAGVLAVKKVT